MSSMIAYSAIAAKISAMRGKLLGPEEFRELAFSESVPAAADYLTRLPAYEKAMESSGREELHRSQIELLLQRSLYQDYSSLYRFASLEQRKFLNLYFSHFEVDILKKCLRSAVGRRTPQLDLSDFEEFFRRHSRLDLPALSGCSTLRDFIAGLSGSCYYGPLNSLYEQGVTVLFDYENTMDILYFTRMWRDLKHHLSDTDRDTVIRCIGEKIDLLNLEWIMRSKNNYHLPAEAIMSFLLPIHFRLKDEQIRKLASSASMEEFMQVLKTTAYGDRFLAEPKEQEPSQSDLFRELLNAVYRLSGRKNPYSAAALNAYFYFKEEEIRKITTTIEGIRYGLDGNQILSCL